MTGPTKKTVVVQCERCSRNVDLSKAKPLSVAHCPHCRYPIKVTAKFGSFDLITYLGGGAMARVYQGVDRTLKRRVAIKIIQDTSHGNDIAIKKCLEEARALAALNHRHVVQIYSVGQLNEQPYIVMELVDGGRLDQLIVDGRPLDEARALEICIDITEGLQAAWGVGLIHGDVKPENILLDPHGVAKLVDFGIARFKHIHQRGQVYGTPQYVAPEVALKQRVDHRADIYSLGATLFHALTGQFPFQGESTNDMILARLDRSPPDPRSYRPTLNIRTAQTVLTMLQPHPSGRQTDYDRLLEDLHAALAAVTPVDEPSGVDLADLDQALQKTPRRLRHPVHRKRRKSSARWIRIAITLLAVIVGIICLIAILLWGVSIRV